MIKFNFKLERVLAVRTLEEEEARNKLLQTRRKLKEIEGLLDHLRQERERVYRYLRQQNETSAQARSYLSWQRRRIKQVEGELMTQRQLEGKEQARYLESRQKREILEKLKEKEFNEFQKQLLQREQKELDELGQRLRGEAVSGR